MLSKSFKPAKCKTSLKLAVARIKLLRNKREVQVKQMKRELAQLLESGQEQTARIRVEHVIREEKTMSAYELIELYCELIAARLPIIESQKSCPIDLKEAVSSVIFASPRCADVPELIDIRKLFTAKYGKDFINAALEVRPDCGVSRLVVEKLSARAPDVHIKVKTLAAIAQEHNVKWDSEKFEEQLKKPHDDLLSGPTVFASSSTMSVEPSNVKPSSSPIRTSALSSMMPQNDTRNRPTRSASEANPRTDTSGPFTSQSESTHSGGRYQGRGGAEINDMHYREEHGSSNQSTRKMEFQDAASAAQAAAESAERASMAARAAAELASRGSLSRQDSTESHVSPSYSKKYERPERLRAFLGEDIINESVPRVNDEHNSSPGRKTEAENLQQDDKMQGISRRETGSMPINDHSTDFNFHNRVEKDSSCSEKLSSKLEPLELNPTSLYFGNFDTSREKKNLNSTEAGSPCSVADHEKVWSSDLYNHENGGMTSKNSGKLWNPVSYMPGNDDETSRVNTGEDFLGKYHEKSTLSNSSEVVFDSYGSDGEENNSVFRRNQRNLLDSYQDEDLPRNQSKKGAFRVDQMRNSFAKDDGSQLHLFRETHPEEHSEMAGKATIPLQSNESPPPAFDNSDGESTENEAEVGESPHKKAMRPNNSLHGEEQSTSIPLSDQSTRASRQSYIRGTTGVEEPTESFGSYEKNTGKDPQAANNSHGSGSSALPHDQPSRQDDKTTRKLNAPVGSPGYSSSDDDEPESLHLTRRRATLQSDDKEMSRVSSTHLGSQVSENSNEFSDESAQGINFGRLTGGFKHRGFPRPPYVKKTAADTSHLSKPISDVNSINEEPISSADLDKQSASSSLTVQEKYNQESHPEAYGAKARTSGASLYSHSNTAEGLRAQGSTENTSGMDAGRSRSSQAKTAEETDVSSRELYYERSQGRGQNEVSRRLGGASYDPDSNEQTWYTADTRRYRDSVPAPQKQRSDRMSSDSDGSQKLVSDYTAGTRVKLSRRTREVPSENNKGSSRVTDSHADVGNDVGAIQDKGSSKPVRSSPSPVQPPMAPKQSSPTFEGSSKSNFNSPENITPNHDGNTKPSSSSEESVSRESSLKKPSHAHPKLPDYESLAAHFHSLRSNRR